MKNNSYLCVTKPNKQMRTYFLDFLASKGASSINFRDERVTFTLNGLNYLFVYDNSDKYYFRLILPNIYTITDDKPRCVDIINNLNKDFKVAKTFVIDNRIWVSVEQFAYSNENISFLFERCISLLESVIRQFRDNLKGGSDD